MELDGIKKAVDKHMCDERVRRSTGREVEEFLMGRELIGRFLRKSLEKSWETRDRAGILIS